MDTRIRRILQLRFNKHQSLRKIGEVFNLSAERIRQIISKNYGNTIIPPKSEIKKCIECKKELRSFFKRPKKTCSAICTSLIASKKEPYCQECKKRGKNLKIASKRESSFIPGLIIYSYMCRKCNTKRARKYRQTIKGKLACLKARGIADKKYPERRKAYKKLQYALEIGKIKRPKICSVCKKEKSIQGHHKDYSKPLEVIWICRQCHIDLHKNYTL